MTHALEYYGRMLFTLLLLPLLRASPSPRVLTVGGGVMLSKKLDVSDLNLEKPGNFGGIKSQTHVCTMNTLFLDRLSADPANGKITFVHNWPGVVNTGNLYRYHTPSATSPLPLTTLLMPVMWLLTFSEKEAGERHLYNATTGSFGGAGPRAPAGKVETGTRGEEGRGLFLVGHKCDVADKGDVLRELREEAQGKVWDLTMEILQPFL